jgi:hypothetical protein
MTYAAVLLFLSALDKKTKRILKNFNFFSVNIPAKISTLSGRLVPTNPDRSSNDSGLVSISQF